MIPAPANLDIDTYNHFLNRWDCKYVRVTLDKWTVNGLTPVLPKVNYMFVHWTADDNTECYKDIYEVSVAVKTCPCCAHCWQRYGHWCTRHSPESHPSYFEYRPVKFIGHDFVTYVDTPHGSPVAPVEASDSVPVEHMPRRSKRIRRAPTFYYGF